MPWKAWRKYFNILHTLFLPQFQNVEFLQAGKHGNIGLR
jgi:hypothetical protein